ncbi:MAG: glycosyltransferase family 4 protein [Pseudomonadota bacterium]
MLAYFAIPGDLATPTGGYVYARRLIREAPARGIDLRAVQLPSTFPEPSTADIEATGSIFDDLDDAAPVLIDGLAGGVLPRDSLHRIRSRKVMLCHHPLALETGLGDRRRASLVTAEREALAACDHVITTSEATGQILRNDYGVSPDRLTVARPGTDTAPRAMANGPCRIVSVGSLTPRKGHERLITALAATNEAEWSLRIIGPHRDAETLDRVKSLIAKGGCENRIALEGALSLPALTAAYQSADLFVLASEYEGFGMAFAEAMSHGLPVLGLSCAAVEEATAGAAMLVAPEAFENALHNLIVDADARHALASRCWTAAQTLTRWPETAAIVAAALSAGQS